MRIAMGHRAGKPSAHSSRTDSLSAFKSQASSLFVPLEVSTEAHGQFTARLSSADAHEVAFTEVCARPHLVERTPETISQGGSGYYKVSLMVAGTSILVQDGREIVMRPGDLSVYDTSRPYSLLFDDDFRNIIMMFPKDRLDMPIPYTEQLTAVSLGEQNAALAPVVSTFLAQFPAQMAQLDDRVRAKLAHTSLDLIGTLFSSILDAKPQMRDPHQVLLQKIYAYIDEHLSAPDLSPGSIAAAHFISTRHLHALFRQAGTTVSTWIRARRLERCHGDLVDPVLTDRTVSAIAARWGFPDAAHFSRVFKAEFGMPPSALRHA